MWWPSVNDVVSTDGTLGVLLLASLISAMLYGVTVLQSMQYYDRFYNDTRVLKFLILVLWLFETMTIVTEFHAVYTYAVTFAGSSFASVSIPWSIPIERAFAFAAVYVVQMFFAIRVWQLRRRHWCPPLLIGLLATGAIVIGLIATVQGTRYAVDDPSWPVSVDVLSATSAGLQIATDAFISISLYWSNRHRVSNAEKRPFLSYLLLTALNRGIFSTLLQILTTVTYSAVHPTIAWIAFHMASNKVHAISLLSTLNTRTYLHGLGHDAELVDARLRDRLERELGGGIFASDLPPNLPTISHGQGLPISPSTWFASKSNDGLECWTPSYHGRSTTAVDGASGMSRIACVPESCAEGA